MPYPIDRLGRRASLNAVDGAQSSNWRLLTGPGGERIFDALRGASQIQSTPGTPTKSEAQVTMETLKKSQVVGQVGSILEDTFHPGIWGKGYSAADRIAKLARFVSRFDLPHSGFYLLGWHGCPRWPEAELDCDRASGLTLEHGYILDRLSRKVGRKFQVLCGTKDTGFFNQALLAISPRPMNGAGRWPEPIGLES